MISDTLADAVAELDGYLASGEYGGEIRERLLDLRHAMDGMRAELDTYAPGEPLYAVVGRSGLLGRNLYVTGAAALAEASGGAIVPMERVVAASVALTLAEVPRG
jgi:hypothetical protein